MTAALRAGILAGYAIAMPVGAVATYLIALSARVRPLVAVAAAMGVATTDGLYALVATVGGVALAGLIAPVAGGLRVAAAVVLVGLAGKLVFDAVRTYRHSSPGPSSRARLAPAGAVSSASARPAAPSVDVLNAAGAAGARSDATGSPVASVTAAGWRAIARTSPGSGAAGRPARGGGSRPSVPSAAGAFARMVAITAVNPATVVYFGTVVVGARAGVQDSGPGAGAAFVLGAFAASASWQLLLAAGGSILGRTLAGRRGRLATALVSAGTIMVLVLVMMVS